MRTLLTVLTLPALTASPTAKPEDVGLSSERLQRINQMIERRIAAGDLAGAVTIVARQGKVVHQAAQGVMDLESKKPMTPGTMFRIASMTKPVIGVAVMMLVEEGKLHLNDPVSRYIPKFRDMKVAVAQPPATPGAAGARAEPATPRRASTQCRPSVRSRSRICSRTYQDSGSGPMGNSDIDKVARKDGDTLADYIPRLGSTALEFQPGSRWTYSPGAGFETLGRVIEIASGTRLDQFFRTRIFDPLGMKDITFWPTDAQMPRVATGLRTRRERPDEDGDAERHDVAKRVLPRLRRTVQHCGRLHPARHDAGERRRAEWEAAARPQDGGDDERRPRQGHAAGTSCR